MYPLSFLCVLPVTSSVVLLPPPSCSPLPPLSGSGDECLDYDSVRSSIRGSGGDINGRESGSFLVFVVVLVVVVVVVVHGRGSYHIRIRDSRGGGGLVVVVVGVTSVVG